MEYESVIKRVQSLSGRSAEDVENLLGYLFYEDDESSELAPIEQDDLIDAIKESNKIAFSLLDGEALATVAFEAAKEINLSSIESRKVFVRFIGGDDLTLESAQRAFTPIEGSIQSSIACDVLMGVTVDPELDDKKIVVLISFS